MLSVIPPESTLIWIVTIGYLRGFVGGVVTGVVQHSVYIEEDKAHPGTMASSNAFSSSLSGPILPSRSRATRMPRL